MRKPRQIFNLLLCLLAIAATAEAGINDGTLPLKLSGEAREMADGSAKKLPAIVHVTSVGANDLGNRAKFRCTGGNHLSRFKAAGIIKVGNKRMKISGICSQPGAANERIEVISRSGDAESRLTGVYKSASRTKTLKGRMKLSGKRFSVDVRK